MWFGCVLYFYTQPCWETWNKHQCKNKRSIYSTVHSSNREMTTLRTRTLLTQPGFLPAGRPFLPHPLTLRCSSSQRRRAGWTLPPGAARTWRGRWRTLRGSGGNAGSPRAGWCRTYSAPWRSWTGRSPSAYAACSHASERGRHNTKNEIRTETEEFPHRLVKFNTGNDCKNWGNKQRRV